MEVDAVEVRGEEERGTEAARGLKRGVAVRLRGGGGEVRVKGEEEGVEEKGEEEGRKSLTAGGAALERNDTPETAMAMGGIGG